MGFWVFCYLGLGGGRGGSAKEIRKKGLGSFEERNREC